MEKRTVQLLVGIAVLIVIIALFFTFKKSQGGAEILCKGQGSFCNWAPPPSKYSN